LIKRFLSSSVNTLSLQNLERSVYIYLHILRQYFIINARKTRGEARSRAYLDLFYTRGIYLDILY